MSMIGKSLAHYSITAQIGKGGMGEVYQATDTKLGRDVAIKVLPEEFAKDVDRVARFQREAKLLASLNHPNIAAIHGLEEVDGTNFLVMELVEGNTLDARIKSGPIPVEEALKLALQIAEALEAAHEKGVIHRDLKPANIKVTPDGKVKVLDFGLAKAFADDPSNMNLSNSPTLSDMATQQGLILGTAAYMSPEQARGKPVDKKTDVWAFGCVLYEMLTGRAAFQGEDVTEILAAVVKSGVDLDLLPADIHPRVREVIIRCLQKEQKKRYGGIGEAQYEIERVLADPSGVFAQPSLFVKPQKQLQLSIQRITAIVILCLIISVVAVWILKPAPAPEPKKVVCFNYEVPESQQLINSVHPVLAVSPDGSQFAYCTSQGIYLRSMNELDARLISGTNEKPLHPFFSPDGKWIGYWSESKSQLKKISVGGGTSIKLCDATTPMGPMWNIDDTIVYVQSDGIVKVSANGGMPKSIVDSKGVPIYDPQILPDGKSVLFSFVDQEGSKIAVQSLESGERKVLREGTDADYLPTGHIVYLLRNNLLAFPFDLETLESVGGDVSMVEGIQWQGNGTAAQYVISNSGTLVYIPGGIKQIESRILARVDREGNIDPLKAPPKAYVSPRVSPDGTKLAVQSNDDDSGSTLWIYDLTDDHEIRQLTFEGKNYRPIWTPNSQRITFASDRDGAMSLYWMPADGSESAERLTTAEDGTSHWPDSWSRDGMTLAYTVERAVNTNYDICLISPGGEPECIYDHPNTVYMGAQFSPDGHWIAYSSGPDASLTDVYIEPFPATGSLQRITQGGGRGVWPMWSPNGRELFYRPTTGSGQGIALIAMDITTNPEFTFRNERRMPIEGFSTISYYRGYDIIPPDGAKFVMTFPDDYPKPVNSENRKIIIVTNWFEELKERVPVE